MLVNVRRLAVYVDKQPGAELVWHLRQNSASVS